MLSLPLHHQLSRSRKIKQLPSVKAEHQPVEEKLSESLETLTGDTFRNESRDQELGSTENCIIYEYMRRNKMLDKYAGS